MLSILQHRRLYAALILLLGVCLALCGCTPDKAVIDLPPSAAPTPAAVTASAIPTPTATPPASPVPAATSDAALSRSLYEAVLTCEPEAGRIDGQLRLTYVNNTGETLYDLTLRLWPNGVKTDSLKILDLTQEGVSSYYALDGGGSVMNIPLNRDLAPGAQVQVYLAYTLTVPEGEGRLSKNELGLLLGGAMPIAAMRENGAWRTESYISIGDPSYSEIADYKVVVRCPETHRVATSGSVYEASIGSDGIYEAYILAPQIRDFAMALCKSGFEATAQTQSGVKVTAYDRFRDRAQYLADTAASALDYYEARLGPYPYAEMAAVGGEITGGMEYSGLIMAEHDKLADNNNTMGELFIAHEVAHQWFFGLCGTDSFREPWVDEALVEFLAMDYLRGAHGDTYMQQMMENRLGGLVEYTSKLPMTATLAEFAAADDSEYFYTVYARGCGLYAALYEKLGEEVFYETLRALCADHAFGFLTGEDIIMAFSAAAGENLRPFFAEHQQLAPVNAAADDAA